MTLLKCIGFIFLGLISLVIGVVYLLSIQRDCSTWVEHIQIAKNITVDVELTYSQRKVYGGHGLGWGGGDYKNSIKFNYNGVSYFHETPYIPIVIRLYEDAVYIIYHDRETYPGKITYKFYRSTTKGEFKEIMPSKFPKHIAIQNRWFTEVDNAERLIGLDPDKMTKARTTRIWYMIEGMQSIFIPQKNPVSIDFVKQYKEKYITNKQED